MSKPRRSGRRRRCLKCLATISAVSLAVAIFVAERNALSQSIALPSEDPRSLPLQQVPTRRKSTSKNTGNTQEESPSNRAGDDTRGIRRYSSRENKKDDVAAGESKKRQKEKKKRDEKKKKLHKKLPLDDKDKQKTSVIVAKATASAVDDQRKREEGEKNKVDRKKKKRDAEKNQEILEAVLKAVEDADSNSTVPNCLDPHGPQPIILMSLGRSGSGSTWQVLGSLTGMETPSIEYTGSSREESLAFFDKVGMNDGGWWVMKYMCYVQRKFPKAGVVGFKWKPNRSFTTPGSINGLKLLAQLKNPSIKIVRSRRNLLDVILSRYKHQKQGRDVPAHCRVGDEDCLKKQLKAGTGVTLPTHKLLDLLKTLSKEEDEVDERLKELGVPHVQASFEELYHGQDAAEWIKIFRFLGVGPLEGLTLERVNGEMAHAATSHPSHEKAIRNWDEVRNLLSGTEFEELLHLSSPVPELVSPPAVLADDKVDKQRDEKQDRQGSADGTDNADGRGDKRNKWNKQKSMQAMADEIEDTQTDTNTTVSNCLHADGPQPVILMTLGRSASSSTWQVIGSLTGKVTESYEYTGSNEKKAQRFFAEIGPNDGGRWLMAYMCYMQRKNTNAGVVGFKWKPFYAIQMPASINALSLVAKSRYPSIKVVRSRRNLLDVMISKEKHRQYEVPAHCEAGDKDCVELHLEAGKGIELPTDNLLHLLGNATKEEHEADALLDALDVPHVHVSFEKLYYGDDANEWKKMFRFLGVGPKEGLKMERVNAIMKHASTSHPSHKKTLRNYDQVRSLLSGTEFEELLHP